MNHRCEIPDDLQTEILRDGDVPCCVGIDIGTTTVCAYVLDCADGTPMAVFRMPNGADLPPLFEGDHRQDADVIFARVKTMLDAVLSRFPCVSAIGFTGQMHGIVCTDDDGGTVSPLYTWQDERAGQGTPCALDIILEKTRYRISAGYGLATVYALMRNGDFSQDTACICTVMDFVAARLCGVTVSHMHTTNAASLGLFDMEHNTFDAAALDALGIDGSLLPAVCDEVRIVGQYRGIPVTTPIGDNQASFFGAVHDPETTALANFGTGSQISLLAPVGAKLTGTGAVECRPFLDHRTLVSGAALCGGRAYAMLERFFGMYRTALGLGREERYDILNALAAQGYEQARRDGDHLSVLTTFCGTREDPGALGAVMNISEARFTPQALAAGVLFGMAEELYRMYEAMPHGHITALAASGNAVRKNPVLCRILSDVFGVHVQIPAATEEAAFGAAMTAARTALTVPASSLGGWVRYREH